LWKYSEAGVLVFSGGAKMGCSSSFNIVYVSAESRMICPRIPPSLPS